MMCYHALLLLELSNDVEENTGLKTINEVVDSNQTILADFSQADPRFGHNRGKQCIAIVTGFNCLQQHNLCKYLQ